MSAGRCAGCGYTDASCKKVKAHVMTCDEYLALFKSNPAAALDPEKEHERWKMEQDATKETRRDGRIQAFRERDRKRLAVQEGRWDNRSAVSANTIEDTEEELVDSVVDEGASPA